MLVLVDDTQVDLRETQLFTDNSSVLAEFASRMPFILYADDTAPDSAATPQSFTNEQRRQFLTLYAYTKQPARSAATCGVMYNTMMRYKRENELFAIAMQEAEAYYKDLISSAWHKRAVEGVEVPIIGGKGRDQIVGYKREYSDRLLELKIKREFPELAIMRSERVTHATVDQNVTEKTTQIDLTKCSPEQIAVLKQILETMGANDDASSSAIGPESQAAKRITS